MTKDNKPTGLDLLRVPFEENQISKLPKGTKAQNECDAKEKINCRVCGGWHHPKIIHLDYVGHAALNDRLLDCDPHWNWEPVAFDAQGQPLIVNNSMWIKLTVCGVTRFGFGDAQGKTGANAIKEIIGDALRNAAMRFGAALDLWHKGDLHAHHANDENLIDNDTDEVLAIEDNSQQKAIAAPKWKSKAEFDRSGLNDIWIKALDGAKTVLAMAQYYLDHQDDIEASPAKEGIANRFEACVIDLISMETDSEELGAEWKLIVPIVKSFWFYDGIKEAYAKRGTALKAPVSEAV